MATRWRPIRVPVELAERLARVAALMLSDHEEGRSSLPNEYCESVPIHLVIEKTLDDWEAHRLRSRAPRRRKVGT